MDNGLLQVTISKPDGHVTRIQGYGIDNMLEVRNKETNRGYIARSIIFLNFEAFVS